jgi:hypothetical protein
MAPSTKVLGENLAKVVADSGTRRVAAVSAGDPYHAELGAAFRERFAGFGSVDLAADSAGFAAGTAGPVPPWMGNLGGPLMVGLRDGEKTADQTATDFMTVYPQSN